MRVHLADAKGFHRFPAADLEHEGVVHTAAISASNSIIVTGSQAACIQVGRQAGQLPHQMHYLQIQLTKYTPDTIKSSSWSPATCLGVGFAVLKMLLVLPHFQKADDRWPLSLLLQAFLFSFYFCNWLKSTLPVLRASLKPLHFISKTLDFNS